MTNIEHRRLFQLLQNLRPHDAEGSGKRRPDCVLRPTCDRVTSQKTAIIAQHQKNRRMVHNCRCAFCPVARWPLCPTCPSFTFYHLYNIIIKSMSRYRSSQLFSQLIKHTCLLRDEFYFVSLLSVKLVHGAS